MPPPLAYFLTWTTYGTWLPGDDRGWIDGHSAAWHMAIQAPDPLKQAQTRSLMTEPELWLTPSMRPIVEATIEENCRHHGWTLHAASARSNHVHVVVSAGDVRPERVLNTFKAYCTRSLKRLPSMAGRTKWWTEDGSKGYLNTEDSLRQAILYVQGQDVSWIKD